MMADGLGELKNRNSRSMYYHYGNRPQKAIVVYTTTLEIGPKKTIVIIVIMALRNLKTIIVVVMGLSLRLACIQDIFRWTAILTGAVWKLYIPYRSRVEALYTLNYP